MVICGSSLKDKGVHPVLDCIIDYLPSPLETPALEAIDNKGTAVTVKGDPSGSLAALVFKVISHY